MAPIHSASCLSLRKGCKEPKAGDSSEKSRRVPCRAGCGAWPRGRPVVVRAGVLRSEGGAGWRRAASPRHIGEASCGRRRAWKEKPPQPRRPRPRLQKWCSSPTPSQAGTPVPWPACGAGKCRRAGSWSCGDVFSRELRGLRLLAG